MSRRRKLRIALATFAALVLLTTVAVVLVIRSAWFFEQVRARIVATVETATGGRVDVGAFRFDWRTMRAEIRGFTLHGTETAEKPPLLRASSISVGLKIVSALKRDVDIQSLDVEEPRVSLIVYPDGRTNIPEPKVKGKGNAVDDILKLAIDRFSLRNGWFEVDSRGGTPFDAQGRNLAARFAYERGGPRYRGTIAIEPLDLSLPHRQTIPFAVNLAVAVEHNRIAVTSARLATGATVFEVSGSLDDLNAPRASFQYDARVSLNDIARIFDADELRAGTAEVGGSGTWSGAAGLAATGNLRASGVHFQDRTITLHNGRMEGAVAAGPNGIDVTGGRIAATYVTSRGQAPAEGSIREIAIRRGVLDLHDVALSALGGSFTGEGRLREWKFYTVTGEVAGFDARKVVALYSPEPLPWDGLGSGPVQLAGTIKDKRALRASAALAISPAAGSPPVHGQLNAGFDGSTETVDVGNSTLTLPSSRATFTGVYGRLLRAHLETTDLNDLLPILGQSANDLPVKLQHGSATFDGTVTGELAAPRFDGRLVAKSFTVEGKPLDWLDAEVTASPETAQLRNATATRGTLRSRFDLQARLDDWKLVDDSEVFGNARLENASLAELLTVADAAVPATGLVTGSTQLTGTAGRPLFKGELTVIKGALREEPFERLTATFASGNDRIDITAGRIVAGEKQVDVTGTFRHEPGTLDSGRLTFRAASNVMPIAHIATLQAARPGATGTVQVTANGELDIGAVVRIATLHADVMGRGLALTGQSIGDAHFTADTQGQMVRTLLEANVANSAIRGEGSWRLEGDYPGSATISFSRLDFSQIRAWVAPSDKPAADRFTGFAEGEMRIEGPALKPDQLRAELRLPKLEIGPAPSAGLPANLTLHNAAPVVATLANSVLTVQSARLTGRATDVTVSGRVLLQSDRSPLDLRVAGKIDIGIVQDFNPDFVASGALAGEALLRGKLEAPLITGRVQVQNAALNVIDFPNGMSNANGTILFTGDRATIEKLTGETGGGKVEFSGFLSYPGDRPVFQLQAIVTQVRVRYPEGVSTVANADLRLAGTADRSTVSGTITVLRTGFNPQSDFSSVIAKSAEPVRTPPARTGLLGGLNFDVLIETAPDIQFQSSLTQDLQVEANLRLRGNPSNPALLGRINITQGQMVFFGTRYAINQGSVAFYNPLKIEPILDIDLETKARGIDVTLTVSGPLNKLNLTPRSDPPLQFSEIVALLATGRAPTASAAQITQYSTSPQAYQQLGASALLGQAITSPVAGRLQRFFGVSKLRIDPTLPGVETNTQARLTVEQQVTRDVTVTYITNVTNVNAQSVRVEWSVTKQWSVVFLREENGVNSLDFLYKKRF